MNAIHSNHSYGSSAFIHTRDGRKLHYMSKGTGHPIVVFESGMGFSRSAWGLVAPQVAEHTQSVVYDRSGLGRSEADTEQRTLRRLAEDLGDLLTELGPGPFILVGHSWGGPVVRAAAAADLSRIRGLILVDPSDENCELYFSSMARISFGLNRFLLPWMARTGLYRKMGSKPGQVQPDDVARDHREEDFTVQAARTMAAESVAFLDDLASLRNTPPELGNIEVRIISGTKAGQGEHKIRPAIVSAHRKSAQGLANGHWIEAGQSGHMVTFTDPQIIIDEILRMANR
ncbi:alpha/beta fold hydrolase [Paenibacillus illinoisensis]|uniref:alpha/beta fold hydrolase n=1 Tax=Paenibacillus illinoisensis TaxID=59845 RepID=UPI000FDB20F4|nr:alpha/beta hydrolase [Paenibacillus illinoisensis]